MAKWNVEVPNTEYYGPLPFNPRGVATRDLGPLIRELEDSRTIEIAVDTETTGLVIFNEQVLYWSLAWGNRRCTLHASVLPYFKHIFADPNKIWIFANAKFDMHMLANMGIHIVGKIHCTQVQHSLLFEEMSHRLKDMAKHLLGWRWSDFQDTFGKINQQNTPLQLMQKAEAENFPLLCEYASNDAWGTLGVYRDLCPRLKDALTHSLFREIPPYIETLWDLFSKVEAPYTRVLWKMERNGILIDTEYLASIQPKAQREIEQLESDVCRYVGWMINIGSTPDLRRYFFDQRKYSPLKMTSGGKSGIRQSSVDADFLQYAADEIGDPVAKMVLEHRNLSKLYGTYIQGIYHLVDAYGRIHSRFNQDVARTGRLSCVAEWTPLKTPRGVLPIKDVEVGDYVWTHRERWRRVLKTVTKGLGYMFDIHLSNGEILTCTTDHRLLDSHDQWLTVGDLIDEHLERLGRERAESEAGAGALSELGPADNRANRREAGDDVPQHLACTADTHAGEGAEDPGQAPLLGLQDRWQEPHEGEERRGTPQLEGGVSGWRWLLDQARGRSSPTSPQTALGEDSGVEGAPSTSNCPSHRRRQDEQPPRQPGGSHEGRSQPHPLYAGKGREAVTITRVNYRGRLEVYDLTVEEDESYLACGVLSHNSADPNLQNIPNVEKDKWRMRAAFIAPPGHKLLVHDYNQLEMRLLAAAARETDMIDIFLRNWDIHMGNASMMMGIPYDELKLAKKIDKEVKEGTRGSQELTARVLFCLHARAAAKNIGFGLNYGMGPAKLANDLGIMVAEAIEKIALYKKTYPAVTRFYEEAVNVARQTGYAFTILGRRRNLPGIASSRRDERARAERQAINVEIQGTAADVMKMAQINLDKAGLDYRYGCFSLLNIHDELIHECPDETAEMAQKEITEWMESPFYLDLDVPLTVAAGRAQNWQDAK